MPTTAVASRAAPLYAGQPGYRAALDRDGDGVACRPQHSWDR
ncbi:excalibur calcium-binding domain-containing protein [Mycolicibacterium sp. BiH015]|nr:excalibur calcium-binding domain-containing protein [Mycolicibacterium sp. BiH015]MDA2890615.1 excalibur calcium-binding domain-containing protein [Mycolicibacterium sp. BiH015]